MELTIDQVGKQYHTKWALRDVSLRCGPGRVSTMISKPNGVYLRVISASRPHEAAVSVEPNLEEALLATNTPVPVSSL